MALVCDIPTVVESTASRAHSRAVENGVALGLCCFVLFVRWAVTECEWCSLCGHKTSESSDQLRPLVPQNALLLPDSMTVLENWPRIVDAIETEVR